MFASLKSLSYFFIIVLMIATPSLVSADWYVPGGWDGGVPVWDNTSNLMNDLGGGIHEITLTNQNPNTRYEFKVLDTSGDWNSHANDPDGSNVWGYSDINGDITITLDENAVGNGFLRDNNRIMVSNDPIAQWNAVGDFMDETGGAGDWDNGDALFAMTDLGGGMFTFTTAAIGTPGTYNGRIVNSGTWDGFGTQGRSVDSWNWTLATAYAGDQLLFELDTTTGTSRVSVLSNVPEPSSAALVGLLGVALLARRKR